MKRFLIQIFVFSSLIGMAFYYVFMQANGYSDPFYLRFTTPIQNSLILGTSRAAQGLRPDVLNKILKKDYIYNYSFSIHDSPFGPAYLESIKRKLNPKTKNGIYIISVDPWSISDLKKNPNDSNNFREKNLAVGKIKLVNTYPNLHYLIFFHNRSFINLIKKGSSKTLLHTDGWLEVNVPMDSTSRNNRLESKIQHYRKNHLKIFSFSSARLKYLESTIHFLQEHGTVYLVRLPMHPKIFEIENELMYDFENKINILAKKNDVKYYNLTKQNDEFDYTDGSHLYRTSAEKVSIMISNLIKNDLNVN